RMKILVKNQRVDLVISSEATNTSAAADTEVSENQINSEIELLRSQDLLTQVAIECGFADQQSDWFSRTPAPEATRVEKAVNDLMKDLSITPVRKANIMKSEAAGDETPNRINLVEQQITVLPKRVVTQSRSLPNQYSAERLNTMLGEMQNRRTQLLTKFRPDDRLVLELDEQIRTTR